METDITKFKNMIFAFVSEKTGFLFSEKDKTVKNYILENRMKINEITSFRSYFEYLKNYSNGYEELQGFINDIANFNTSFFRYKPSFILLTEKVIPDIICKKQKHKNEDNIELNVWSAGCSTGEEAYSIAISLMEAVKEPDRFKIQILATDISTSSLNHAVNGVYSADKLRLVEDEIIVRYFDPHVNGDGKKEYIVKPCIKKLINFKYLNLVEKTTVFPDKMDIIFCRNVFPYLIKKEVNKIISRFYDCCSENGYLFTSATDYSTSDIHMFELIQYSDSMCLKKKEKKFDITNVPPKKISERKKVSDKKPFKGLVDKGIHQAGTEEMPSIFNPLKFETEMLKLKADIISDISKGKKSYLTFLLNGIPFCLDIKKVKEIAHGGYLTTVPAAGRFVKGIMNHRGDILTIIDISSFLSVSEKPTNNIGHLHILVLSNLDCLLGIIIDSQFGTFDAYENMLQPSVVSIDGNDSPNLYVKGEFHIKNRAVSLINLEKLLEIEILEGFNKNIIYT